MIPMNAQHTFLPAFSSPPEAIALLWRLVANLRGFAYRRRNDESWTMEWVSDAFRNVTGYDPHRFGYNQSLSFANLIFPADLPVVSAKINSALTSRHRTTVTYRIKAAHHAVVTVEDRLVGVYDAFGTLIAIEGIIDLAQDCPHPTPQQRVDPWKHHASPRAPALAS